jgi:hypothetical protein
LNAKNAAKSCRLALSKLSTAITSKLVIHMLMPGYNSDFKNVDSQTYFQSDALGL